MPPSFPLQDRLEADGEKEDAFFRKMVPDILLALKDKDDAAATLTRQRMAKLEEERRDLTRREEQESGRAAE